MRSARLSLPSVSANGKELNDTYAEYPVPESRSQSRILCGGLTQRPPKSSTIARQSRPVPDDAWELSGFSELAPAISHDRPRRSRHTAAICGFFEWSKGGSISAQGIRRVASKKNHVRGSASSVQISQRLAVPRRRAHHSRPASCGCAPPTRVVLAQLLARYRGTLGPRRYNAPTHGSLCGVRSTARLSDHK